MQHSQLCFNLENETKDFSYTIFPVKKINVEKIKIMRKLLFNYSLYSPPEIGNFRV
jgi:ribosomal protein S3AE